VCAIEQTPPGTGDSLDPWLLGGGPFRVRPEVQGGWGYASSGIARVVLLIVIALFLTGRL
jgi:hypothetical protein